VTRRPHYRPLIELLETRVVPSTIDYSMGFANHSALTANGSVSFPGSVARLTDGGVMEAGSIFTNSPVDVTHFSTTFTFLLTNHTDPFADGITFTIQASPSGAGALGQNGSGMGYQGIPNSVAIKFDLYNSSGEGTNSTGIFTNGRPPTVRQPGLDSQFPDMSVSLDGTGIDLHSRDPMQATLSYDGSTLTESIRDTVTGATFTQTYSVNIPSIIGSHTAYVGFTGATGGLAATQDIQTWQGTFGQSVTPPLTASGVGTVNGVEGQLLHAVTLATFTGPTSSSGITAVINWGDGTTSNGVITGPDQNGVFTVSGNHTYVEEGSPAHGGPFVITVTLTSGNQTVTVTDNTNIAEAPISATGGFTINAVETQPFTAKVATFTDTGGPENATLDYSATINWGDGTVSTGAISGPDQNGVFTVTGSHAYPDLDLNQSSIADVFTITVTIVHETVSATATSTAVVAEEPEPPPVVTGGFTINAVEGQAFTATVATFTTGNEPRGQFTATINWGDGTVSTGTILGPDQNGVFTVVGSHAYAEESNASHGGNPLIISVTVSNGSSATVFDQAFVAEAPIVASGGFTVSGVEGQSFTATVATFTDTGGPENASLDYTASIDWGDGTTSTGAISGPDQNGVFTVIGSHAYAEETNEFHGTPTITVTIVHETVSAIAIDTPSIAEAPIVGSGGFSVNGVEGQTFTATVATFTDTGGPENASLDYTASIDWGDGTASTGAISGPDQNGLFTVTGSHAYAEETNEFHGTPTITVTITHESASAITVTDTPNIADAPLSATAGAAFSAVVGQDVSAVVATFTDTGGAENAILDYTASIDWGDGTTSTGTISGPDQNGVFSVLGDHAYGADGLFTINVAISHESGGGSVNVSTSATVIGPGGAASLPGQGLTGLNILQPAPVQQATSVPVMITHAPISSQSNTTSNDLYWSQYSSQGDQLIDLNAGIADNLAFVLQGTPS
jgi:hypothetical protein